jgi:hypothetical protein
MKIYQRKSHGSTLSDVLLYARYFATLETTRLKAWRQITFNGMACLQNLTKIYKVAQKLFGETHRQTDEQAERMVIL